VSSGGSGKARGHGLTICSCIAVMDGQQLPDLTTVLGRAVASDMLMETGWSLAGPLPADPDVALRALWAVCPEGLKRELAADYAERSLQMFEACCFEGDPRSEKDLGAPRNAIACARQLATSADDPRLADASDSAWAASQRLRSRAGDEHSDESLSSAIWAACWAAAAAAAACQPNVGDALEQASGFARRAAWSLSGETEYGSGATESEAIFQQLHDTVIRMVSAPCNESPE
jgi:hypothetical protein